MVVTINHKGVERGKSGRDKVKAFLEIGLHFLNHFPPFWCN